MPVVGRTNILIVCSGTWFCFALGLYVLVWQSARYKRGRAGPGSTASLEAKGPVALAI